MAIYDGGRYSEDTINELIESSQKTMGQIRFGGVSGVETSGAALHGVAAEVNDQSYIRQSFLGTVIGKGPNNESDYEDSRYWVRQVCDKSTEITNQHEIDRRPDFDLTNNDDRLKAVFGNRWVAAVNLSEYNPVDPDTESHSLQTGSASNVGPVIVQVFFTMNKVRDATWYFWSGGGGGSTLAFALVRGIYTGSAPFISVQLIVRNTETNVWEFNGEPVDVWCWPPLDSRYYEALVWTADMITPDCNPIGIRQVGGQFYAEQTLLTLPIRSPGVSYSDCRTFA